MNILCSGKGEGMIFLHSIKRGSYPVVLAVILMTCMVFLGGCGGDEAVFDPQPGDEFEATLSVSSGDLTMVRQAVTYKAFDLASGDEEPVVVLLPVSEDVRNVATGSMEAVQTRFALAPELVTIRDWQEWLDKNWDPYIGTDDDPGIDAAEFVAYLEDHNISGQAFVDLYENSGMGSMEEFMTFAEDVAATSDEDDDPLNDLQWFLKQLPELSSQDASMDLAMFLDELEVAYPQEGYESFLDWMIEEELDFQGLYGCYFEYLRTLWNDAESDGSKENFASFLSSVVAGDTFNNSRTGDDDDDDDKGPSGLDVAKFAWDVIKDGKPQVDAKGAFTSVLAAEDNNPLHYAYANGDETEYITFELRNIFCSVVKMKYRGECKYNARNPNFGGYFLPDIHFKVKESDVSWGFHLNVSTQVSNVANIGSFQNPNPQVDLVVNIDSGSFLRNITDSTSFRSEGLSGIYVTD